MIKTAKKRLTRITDGISYGQSDGIIYREKVQNLLTGLIRPFTESILTVQIYTSEAELRVLILN